MLEVDQVDVCYGPVQALKQISFTVEAGEVVALIGANGAGKSTILKAISGLMPASGGVIRFLGQDVGAMTVEKIVSLGVCHVPEGRRIFPGLTVLGNLEVATAGWRRRGQGYREELDRVFRLFPRLKERAHQLGWSLSGGEQQMLAIGRGLMARPKVLMLDEPSLGLAPMLIETVFDAIRSINSRGTTVLLVEQNAYSALSIAHRGYVLKNGRVLISGSAPELKSDPRVRGAYLGT